MSTQILNGVPYNSSIFTFIDIANSVAEHTGGDSLTTNLNQYYNQGDSGFIILCAALVLLMMPGLGYFYSGLARRKSALSLILVCVMAYCVVSFQWYFWGYSVHPIIHYLIKACIQYNSNKRIHRKFR